MTSSRGRSNDDLRQAMAADALVHLPKILTQQDRTPTSRTYGCFDRAYWHMRIMDFPCGMSQEFVLPLALAWALPIPGNPYFEQGEIRRWAEAGIRFAARAAHHDGSCDDYYPFEKAAGAAAFSLFACQEAADLLGLGEDPEILAFFEKRAGWLAQHSESGRLSNHEAIIIACLAWMAQRFGGRWTDHLHDRTRNILKWQSAEGWFDEYGGADPGYLTLTVAMLAQADRRQQNLGLQPAIDRAIAFLARCMQPDGSLGGEYTSRATVNFFPHGLEICGAWNPLALAIADRAYRRFETGIQPCHADDRIMGHHVWSQLLAWKEWCDTRPGALSFREEQHDFPETGLRVQQVGKLRLYCGWTRGAAFRLFDGESLLQADTGPSLRLVDGRVVIANMGGSRLVDRSAGLLEVEGNMAFAKSTLLTPVRSILLRAATLSVGRLFPNLIRRLLQRLLVTGRRDAPFRFRRRLEWDEDGLVVEDELWAKRGWTSVAQAGQGGFQVPLATVMAGVWEPAQLQPWRELTSEIKALTADEPLRTRRHFRPAR
jgi:hypothetical protein